MFIINNLVLNINYECYNNCDGVHNNNNNNNCNDVNNNNNINSNSNHNNCNSSNKKCHMKNKSILHFFLVMSAGGYGHIPLPLIRGEIAYADPPDEYSQEVGFLGNMANGPRKQVLEILKQSFVDSNLSHLFAHSKSIPISCNVSILFIFDTVCFFFFL